MSDSQLQLVLLAAGLGSRFGGAKQLAPVGPGGELLCDLTVADAARAGIRRLVVVLREELAAEFHVLRGEAWARSCELRYVFQPPAAGRVKPWGTGHAVLCARDAVDGPFLVANADDYYGPRSVATLADFLRRPVAEEERPSPWAMVGYEVAATLSEFGPVSRSLCQLDESGFLRGLRESKNLEAGSPEVRAGALVSMNLWALRPAFFAPLAERFARFRERHAGDPQAELFLPQAIEAEIAAGRATVQVFAAEDRWFGITYPGDLEIARRRVAAILGPAPR